MKKLIIASNNKGKIKEFKQMLEPLGYECVSQREAGIETQAEENGVTFAENAFIKANEIRAITNKEICVLADDSGLCVDALNGEPSIYSARYGGLETDIERSSLILQKMQGKQNRKAKFVCSLYFWDSEYKQPFTAQGELVGNIAEKPQGENGFGYDPIFEVDGRTLAQMSDEQKNAISHRGAALENLCGKLKDYAENYNKKL